MTKVYKNVSLNHVMKDLSPTSTYLFSVSYKENDHATFNETTEFYIQSAQLAEKMLNILTRISEREYLAYGMTDIDVYLNKGMLTFIVSPSDGLYAIYEFSKDAQQKLLHIFSNELDKTLKEMEKTP